MNNINPPSGRMIEQDIAKGVAILYVILIHCIPMTEDVDIVVRALLGTALPVFFFLSGYNYKPNNLTYSQNLKKRAKQLFIPLLKYSLSVLALMVIGLLVLGKKSEIISIFKSYIGMWLTDPIATRLGFPTIGTYTGIQRVFEPYWFILYMFAAYVIFYAVIKYAYASVPGYLSIMYACVMGSTILNRFGIVLPWGLHNAPVYASIMMSGSIFKKYDLFNSGVSKKWSVVNFIVAAVLTIFFGLVNSRAGQLSGSGLTTKILGDGEVVYTIFYAFFACYFAYKCACYIKKIPYVSTFLAWFGRNSLPVFMIHLIYMFIAKAIAHADLNASLAHVTKMDWKNILAYVITVVLCSFHIMVIDRIKKRKESTFS